MATRALPGRPKLGAAIGDRADMRFLVWLPAAASDLAHRVARHRLQAMALQGAERGHGPPGPRPRASPARRRCRIQFRDRGGRSRPPPGPSLFPGLCRRAVIGSSLDCPAQEVPAPLAAPAPCPASPRRRTSAHAARKPPGTRASRPAAAPCPLGSAAREHLDPSLDRQEGILCRFCRSKNGVFN